MKILLQLSASVTMTSVRGGVTVQVFGVVEAAPVVVTMASVVIGTVASVSVIIGGDAPALVVAASVIVISGGVAPALVVAATVVLFVVPFLLFLDELLPLAVLVVTSVEAALVVTMASVVTATAASVRVIIGGVAPALVVAASVSESGGSVKTPPKVVVWMPPGRSSFVCGGYTGLLALMQRQRGGSVSHGHHSKPSVQVLQSSSVAGEMAQVEPAGG